MSVLKSVYDNQADIPKGFESIFGEKNGKWEVTGIEGLKPETAFAAVQEGLRKERADHGEAKKTLKAFSDLGKSPDEIHAILDTLPQLQLAAEGKVKELTEAQKNALTAPLNRSIETLTKDLNAATAQVQQFQTRERQRTVDDAVRAVATELKVLPGAVEDVLLWARATFDVSDDGKVVVKEGVTGVPAGLDPKAWLQDQQTKKAHWWPASQGGGAGGSSGQGGFPDNPWTKAGWNLTKQAAVIRDKGDEVAKRMAAAAGVDVHAMAPKA